MLRVDMLVCRQVADLAQTERLVSEEEQLTLITESMSITSADQEKLQLLNKNTELRRLNKEVRSNQHHNKHIHSIPFLFTTTGKH